MNIATVAFVTEKAPQGGYTLKQIRFELDAEGKPTVLSLETVASRTTLIEATEVESRMKKEVFAEEALAPPIERVHYLPAPQQPQHPPRPDQYPPMENRPAVLDGMDNPPPREPDQSLVERAKQAMGRNGRERVNAVLFAAFVTLAMAAHSMGLRA